MSVRIAALILSYRYPSGIAALARFFAAADIEIFIHVDGKCDDRPFRDAAKAGGRDAVFIEDRTRIFWRGFSMVQATVNLLRASHLHAKFDRYLIISDDCLPLVEPMRLRNELEFGGDFVAATLADEQLRLRYDRFFMFDSAATQVRWIPVIDREIGEDALRRFERLGILRKRGKRPLAACYHGSQWMALTSASVDKILRSWTYDPWLRESFEFSEVPDESYFHTILFEAEVPVWRPLVYADWAVDSPPRIFKTPGELLLADARGALFARKIDFSDEDLSHWLGGLGTQARLETNTPKPRR